MTQVAVSEDEPRLCYHDPSQLASMVGMTLLSKEEAREQGAVECGECFADEKKVMYDFPYLEGGVSS